MCRSPEGVALDLTVIAFDDDDQPFIFSRSHSSRDCWDCVNDAWKGDYLVLDDQGLRERFSPDELALAIAKYERTVPR